MAGERRERPAKQKAEQMIGTSWQPRGLDRATRRRSIMSHARTRSRHDRAACHGVRISLNRGANWRNVARCLGLLRGPLAWEYNMRGKRCRCRCRQGKFAYVSWAEASGGGLIGSGRALLEQRIVRRNVIPCSVISSGIVLRGAARCGVIPRGVVSRGVVPRGVVPRGGARQSAAHYMGVVGCTPAAERRER
jgi:hypothetical protein